MAFAIPRAVLISAVRCSTIAAMPDRPQQLRIEPRQPCQSLGIQPIVFAAALADQLYLTRVGHDHFMSHLRQPPAHPRRVRPHFDRHPAPPDRSKQLHQAGARRGDFPFLDHFAG
jgi:hypothetical protein